MAHAFMGTRHASRRLPNGSAGFFTRRGASRPVLKRELVLITGLATALLLLAAASAPIPEVTSGCVNDQLSDGVWAVRVLSVQPGVTFDDGVQTKGVAVNLQVRNVTTTPLHPDQTGFSDVTGSNIKLKYVGGASANLANAGSPAEVLFDRRLVPGETATLAFYFPYPPKSHAKPAMLIIPVKPRSRLNSAHVAYGAVDPTFRVDLTCHK
jgi:hypothetical protein